MDYIFTVNNLKKTYRGNFTLDIEELNIAEGQITAIIGPSGAGKSTLLKILNGIESPSGGVMIFDGETLKPGKRLSLETRRKMTMVFQKPVLLNSSVYENIAYAVKIRHLPGKTIREKVTTILDLIGLKEKAHQKALTLSGGEAQRVAIARALVIEPKLLLLDEPTSDLDPTNVAIIEGLIKHAKSTFHSTVITVTHNMYQARRLADHVIFLMNGKVIEAGPPQKLFTEPDNEKTRAFITGDMVY